MHRSIVKKASKHPTRFLSFTRNSLGIRPHDPSRTAYNLPTTFEQAKGGLEEIFLTFFKTMNDHPDRFIPIDNLVGNYLSDLLYCEKHEEYKRCLGRYRGLLVAIKYDQHSKALKEHPRKPKP